MCYDFVIYYLVSYFVFFLILLLIFFLSVLFTLFFFFVFFCSFFVLFFFFFQAEDGIRDLTVTGVQTCALPISDDEDYRFQLPVVVYGYEQPRHGGGSAFTWGSRDVTLRSSLHLRLVNVGPRSEERRVGKECRSRGSRYS